MKNSLAILLVSISLIPVLLQVNAAEAQGDMIGLYASLGGEGDHHFNTSAAYQRVTLYLVLKNPTLGREEVWGPGASGWECQIEIEGNPLVPVWTYAGDALNIYDPNVSGYFNVGVGPGYSALRASQSGEVLLATYTAIIPSSDDYMTFRINPFPGSVTFPEGCPGYVHPEDVSVLQCLSVEYDPAFIINQQGISFRTTITGMDGETPVYGARVDILGDGVSRLTGYTDRDGYCQLGRDWEGDDVYYTASVSYGDRQAVAEIGYMSDGETRNVAASIPMYIELGGYVLDAMNQGRIAGARVDIFSSEDPDTRLGSSTTDSRGRFRYDALEPGAYFYRAYKVGPVGTGGVDVLYRPTRSETRTVAPGEHWCDLGTVELETNVVVLVHGINSNSDNWETNGYPASLRARDWAVLDGIDLPGALLDLHGFARIKEQAEYLKARVDEVGVHSVHVVAHSQGGLVSRYMNETLAGEKGNVVKLITMATPHHGSPLASVAIGVREWLGATLFKFNPVWQGYSLLRLMGVVDSFLPALDDLSPNSGFLKELNQRKTGLRVWDWGGGCMFDSPNTEKELKTRTHYLTLRASGYAGVPYLATSYILASLFRCGETDGIVPTESAWLHDEGENVHNYFAGSSTHHKSTMPGIVENSTIRTWVLDRLDQDPALWPEETKSFDDPVSPLSSQWVFSGYNEIFLTMIRPTYREFVVDDCDSLRVAWSWSSGGLDYKLRTPGGVVVDSTYASENPAVDMVVDRDAQRGFIVLHAPDPGNWRIECEVSYSIIEQNIVTSLYTAGAISMDAALSDTGDDASPDRILAVTLRTPDDLPVLDADVDITVVYPTGGSCGFTISDDGVLPDEALGDGVYTGSVHTGLVTGSTSVSVSAQGTTPYAFNRNTVLNYFTSPALDVRIHYPLVATSGTGLAMSPVVLRTTVYNSGSIDAAADVRFTSGDGDLLAVVKGVVPDRGVCVYETTFLPLAAGDYDFNAVVLPIGDYADSDLANNTSSVSISIDPPQVVSIEGGGGADPDVDLPTTLGDRRAAILAAYPNPFNPAIRIDFALAEPEEAEVLVFNVRGRLVRELFSGRKPAGKFSLDWDGTDGGGHRVSAGLYFVHLRSAMTQDIRKIMLMK